MKYSLPYLLAVIHHMVHYMVHSVLEVLMFVVGGSAEYSDVTHYLTQLGDRCSLIKLVLAICD